MLFVGLGSTADWQAPSGFMSTEYQGLFSSARKSTCARPTASAGVKQASRRGNAPATTHPTSLCAIVTRSTRGGGRCRCGAGGCGRFRRRRCRGRRPRSSRAGHGLEEACAHVPLDTRARAHAGPIAVPLEHLERLAAGECRDDRRARARPFADVDGRGCDPRRFGEQGAGREREREDDSQAVPEPHRHCAPPPAETRKIARDCLTRARHRGVTQVAPGAWKGRYRPRCQGWRAVGVFVYRRIVSTSRAPLPGSRCTVTTGASIVVVDRRAPRSPTGARRRRRLGQLPCATVTD